MTDRARELRVVQAFSDLNEADLAFLAELATFRTLQPGETLFQEGDPARVMFAVLDGEIRSKREHGVSDGRLFIRRTGQIGGMLPFSRITAFPVTARAALPTRVACFDSGDFPVLLARVGVLESRLASLMADRVREAAQYDQHRDKLSSLGKLSAGLAHEINNPTGAIQRSAAELERRVDDIGGVVRTLLGALVPSEPVHELGALAARTRPEAEVDALERSDAEDAMARWLAELGVEESWALASDLVSAGVRADALQTATREVPPALVRPVAEWLESELAARQLVREVAGAAARIASLVAAVKSFSHLDRAPVATEVDVREGIASTLAVLSHRLRSKGVQLELHHADALPTVRGTAGELNQVWANLIDNAIDAVAEGGRIEVRSSAEASELVVSVTDDGSGIPEDVRWRIFEPFFTTKEVGQGTGLGLDLVQRVVQAHGGDVHVESEPGRTRFEVRLPIGGPPAER